MLLKKFVSHFLCVLLLLFWVAGPTNAQVIISQYYEGTGTNKWLELTNLGNNAVNPATTVLKVRIWSQTSDTGLIAFTGNVSTMTINVTIPAGGTILLGNSSNGTTGTSVPYLTASSANQTNNSVISFNGNDGIALLDANDNVLDRFGTGINAKDVSYTRNLNVTGPSTTFTTGQWTAVSLNAVHTASANSSVRLGVHGASCQTPTDQATNGIVNAVSANQITASFNASASADQYLIIQSTVPTLSQFPQDGVVYTAGSAMGNGNILQVSNQLFLTANNLQPATTYYFHIFSIRQTACNGGPRYLTLNPLLISQSTWGLCSPPTYQASNFQLSTLSSNSIQLQFTASSDADEYLIVRNTNTTLNLPVDGITYQRGQTLGSSVVVYRGPLTSFVDWGLDGNMWYFYKVYSIRKNNCSGGPVYKKNAPLKGQASTPPTTLQWYYGNLHSHTALSDGTGPATAAFNFSEAALCMDFLGVSDHNHGTAGMTLANWEQGKQEADSFSNQHFLAMYGMEWGTISTGGHVVVYGEDSLVGWEPGNYQKFVAEGNYTGQAGLFDLLNQSGKKIFTSLAHPDNADFNQLSTTYTASADNMVAGCAVENGPSTSSDTLYSDYPSPMAYLSYYRGLLAQGYHVGPTIDHDNHNLTHGRTAFSRTAVLSASLAKHHVMDALKQRRFMATQDCGAVIDFTVNGAIMGSQTVQPGVPVIQVNASTSVPISTLRIQSGIPGSGTNATILTSTTTSSLNFTHQTFVDGSTRYYYVDITLSDGRRIISSPIWYTRNDALIANTNEPVVIQEFLRPAADSNTLRWSVNRQHAGQYFVLEHSEDGIVFQHAGTQTIQFNSEQTINYQYLFPAEASVMRLSWYDATGHRLDQRILPILKQSEGLLILSNPVLNTLSLQWGHVSGSVQFQIFSEDARMLHAGTAELVQGKMELQDMSRLNKGIYFVQLKLGDRVESIHFLKL